jgi:amino acid permease
MTIAIVILLPLTLLQNINALSYTSIIALGSVLYVVCMITTKGILKVVQSGLPDDLLLFNPSVDILHSFSIIVFSFSVQFNVRKLIINIFS